MTSPQLVRSARSRRFFAITWRLEGIRTGSVIAPTARAMRRSREATTLREETDSLAAKAVIAASVRNTRTSGVVSSVHPVLPFKKRASSEAWIRTASAEERSKEMIEQQMTSRAFYHRTGPIVERAGL